MLKNKGEQMSKALALTWKTWSYDEFKELKAQYDREGFARSKWTVSAKNQAYVGMPVIAYSQRDEGRGIFGIGLVANLPESGDESNMFEILFVRFADPLEKPLLDDSESKRILDHLTSHQASGATISIDQYAEIARLIG
jgi:hypothetical protein